MVKDALLQPFWLPKLNWPAHWHIQLNPAHPEYNHPFPAGLTHVARFRQYARTHLNSGNRLLQVIPAGVQHRYLHKNGNIQKIPIQRTGDSPRYFFAECAVQPDRLYFSIGTYYPVHPHAPDIPRGTV